MPKPRVTHYPVGRIHTHTHTHPSAHTHTSIQTHTQTHTQEEKRSCGWEIANGTIFFCVFVNCVNFNTWYSFNELFRPARSFGYLHFSTILHAKTEENCTKRGEGRRGAEKRYVFRWRMGIFVSQQAAWGRRKLFQQIACNWVIYCVCVCVSARVCVPRKWPNYLAKTRQSSSCFPFSVLCLSFFSFQLPVPDGPVAVPILQSVLPFSQRPTLRFVSFRFVLFWPGFVCHDQAPLYLPCGCHFWLFWP